MTLEGETAPNDPDHPGHPKIGPRPRILAIDDDPAILSALKAVLRRAYDLAEASDGEQGLSIALSIRPDLILTDYDMPKATGQEFLARLRADPSFDDVPVIVLTAYEDYQLRVDLLRNGAQDYLLKPFSGEEVHARIANLLRVKQARELLQEELETRERDIGALVADVAARRGALQTALEAARAARGQAEEANRAKTTFLALVSHELLTPLTSLRLNLETLQRRSPTPSTELERMERSVERLKSVVDGVLLYTTVQSGRIEPRRGPTDLVALLATLCLELAPVAAAKGLSLEYQVADEAKLITIDQGMLRLILSNLIDNALKYTDHGSIRINACINGGLVLTVCDSGRGIDPQDADRIFEPFAHGERIANKSTPGVGLGLALVRNLATAIGGQVGVESRQGVGSTFTVTLP